MPFVFSHVEYCDMHCVCGFCNGNACAAVDEHHRCSPDQRILSRVVFSHIHQTCVRLVVFQVLVYSLKWWWFHWLRDENILEMVQRSPLVELPLTSVCHVCRCGKLYMRKIYILTMITGYNIWNEGTLLNVWICATG